MNTYRIAGIQDDPEYLGNKADFLMFLICKKSFLNFKNLIVTIEPVDDFIILQIINKHLDKNGQIIIKDIALNLDDAIALIKQTCYKMIIQLDRVIVDDSLRITVKDTIPEDQLKSNRAEEQLISELNNLQCTNQLQENEGINE